METPEAPIWRINPEEPERDAILACARIILEAGVVIYPTETFYGLGGHPGLVSAIRKVYGVKGRDFEKALPVIASDLAAARRSAAVWPVLAERLAKAFWPGPLTLIVPASEDLPAALHANTGKIAVRVSSHLVARDLAAAVGGLLISTSANRSSEPAYDNSEELPRSFLQQVDGLLNAGRLPGKLPSTIVDVSLEVPLLVRSGCLSWARIERIAAGG